MTRKKSTLVILLMLMLVPAISLAASPSRHTTIALTYIERYPNDEIAQKCANYQKEFVAGAVCTDFTVDLYLADYANVAAGTQDLGGYAIVHNWGFQQRVMQQAANDAERCLAYGIVAHLIPDSIWHNNVVSDAIESTGLPNIPYHPLYELQDELYLQRNDPQLIEVMKNTCTIFEENPRYAEMFQNAIGTNSPVRVSERMKSMSNLMGSNIFYDGTFKGYKDNPFYGIAKFAASSIRTTPTEQIAAGETAVEKLRYIFNNFNERYSCTPAFCPAEPHGFTKLQQADSNAGTGRLLIIGSFIVVIALIVIAGSRR